MSDIVRVSTIQVHDIPTLAGLHRDPFDDKFRLEDLFETVERSVSWYETMFDLAGANGCKLTVATEDFSRTGLAKRYLDDPSIFRSVVERQTPMIAERLGASAKKNSMYIVASYYVVEDDTIFNVADLFDPKGEIAGRYRKVHLPEYERWQVDERESFPVFETDIGSIAMLVCYDQVWPEAMQACALNGAQLVCCPSAATMADYRIRCRANDAMVHIITSTHNNSMVATPRAEIVANAGWEDHVIAWADVDLDGATMGYEFFWDCLLSGLQDHRERQLKYRRPNAYKILSDPNPPLAKKFPTGNVANTPEDHKRVYEIYKAAHRKELAGEEIPWTWPIHWDQPEVKHDSGIVRSQGSKTRPAVPE